MLNALDIMAETEDADRRQRISDEVIRRYRDCDFSKDPTDYMLFLAGPAAVFGVEEAERYELAYLEKVGLEEFLRKSTSDARQLYLLRSSAGSLLRRMDENDRNQALRTIPLPDVCGLGLLECAGAVPALERIVARTDEDEVVQAYAVHAIENIRGSQPGTQA